MAAVGLPSQQETTIGMDFRTVRCWEYGKLLLPSLDEESGEAGSRPLAGKVQVVSAWFGDAADAAQRRDITAEVQEMIAASDLASPRLCDGKVSSLETAVAVHATTRSWGDPAPFRVKQLEVSYVHDWLSEDERAVMQALSNRANEKAQGCPDLEVLLPRLGSALLGAAQRCLSSSSTAPGSSPGSPSAGPSESLGGTSPRWRQLGFQSSNPRTDLRTGILALDAMVYLAERYPLATGQMVREAQNDGIDYPFAVASINITQHLARYLHLVRDGSSGGSASGIQAAPPRVVQRFARLLLSSGAAETSSDKFAPDAFCELHAAVLARLHATWKGLKTENPHLTVMHFGPAMEQTLFAVRSFCLIAEMETPSEFRSFSGRSVSEVLIPAEQPPDEAKDSVRVSVQRTLQNVSESASILGTYLSGVFNAR
ncbi:unnamed protein product [Polarella glacialis]|uniref:ELMO domain-containing protein n=1 Tax=Polarella glacialis TaxID=89957 RepID=A0A813GE03_POLGL|nr:unnamed protein product [Polarella glacialis]CAE8623361.1 unnamed protein product [Polarella glacialis]